MSRIKSLRQAKADTFAAMKAKRDELAAATTDADRDRLKTEFKALETKFDGLDDDLKAEELMVERERSLTPVRDDDSEAARRTAGAARVEIGKNNADEDPKRGFKSHTEFLRCVMTAHSGRHVDARLKPLAAAGSDEGSTSSDPFGGFLIPEAFAPQMLMVRAEDDPTAGATTRVPMSAPSVKIPARTDKDHSSSVSGGFTVTRRPETVQGQGSRVATERITLEAHELFGLGYATETLINDSPGSFVAIIQASFSDEFNARILDEKLNGSGVGEYLGVMNAPCLITVNKETGQAADTIMKENVDKMRARCWRYGRAIWLANHDTLPQLKSLVQLVGTGGAPVPYFTVTNDGQAMLDGRPLYFTEFASSIGDLGDLILGNWSEYLEGQFQGLQQAESIHVRFEYNERAFKFWLRNDGQPWWRSALTPRKGAMLSPFVTLQAR
jgi:HK97 family phage major capsid protein